MPPTVIYMLMNIYYCFNVTIVFEIKIHIIKISYLSHFLVAFSVITKLLSNIDLRSLSTVFSSTFVNSPITKSAFVL